MQAITHRSAPGAVPAPGRDHPCSCLRIGLFGAGEQATTRLLPILQNLANVDVVGLVDIDPHKLTSAADRFRVPVRAATAQDLLEMVEVDAIVAACPPRAHDEIARFALDRHLPVFVEKPPAPTTSALHRLATQARETGTITGVGMNFRWAAPVRQAVSLLAQLDAGPPVSVSITHLANKPQNGLWGLDRLAGYLLAQAIHPIDLLLHFSGPLSSVDTVITPANRPLHIELHAATTAGGVASLSTGIHSGPMRSRVEIVTETGVTITVDDLATLRVDGLDRERHRWSQHWRQSPLHDGSTRTGYQPQLEAFADAVLSRGPFQPSLADLLPAYQTIDLIIGSAP